MLVLLLVLATPQTVDPLIAAAQSRLSAVEPAAPVRSAYRIDGEDGIAAIDAKDRAIRADGSKCNVVGARRCPKRGRTFFRTTY